MRAGATESRRLTGKQDKDIPA